ncbi:MAG: tellurite resistance TerB family protein [Alphaproteobacteria bacterium]
MSTGSPLDPQTSLIAIMVMLSAADSDMTDQELFAIGEVVRTLPIFRGFNEDGLVHAADHAATIIDETDSLDDAVAVARAGLPDHLCETGYALACEIAAADGAVAEEEVRALEIIRFGLGLDRLTAAAIERCVRARHQTL